MPPYLEAVWALLYETSEVCEPRSFMTCSAQYDKPALISSRCAIEEFTTEQAPGWRNTHRVHRLMWIHTSICQPCRFVCHIGIYTYRDLTNCSDILYSWSLLSWLLCILFTFVHMWTNKAF